MRANLNLINIGYSSIMIAQTTQALYSNECRSLIKYFITHYSIFSQLCSGTTIDYKENETVKITKISIHDLIYLTF